MSIRPTMKKLTSNLLSLATTAMDGASTVNGTSAGFAGATNRSAPILGQPPGWQIALKDFLFTSLC